jgi:hypothetical protein
MAEVMFSARTFEQYGRGNDKWLGENIVRDWITKTTRKKVQT